MVTSRPGHSLAELIVAITLLAAGLVGVGATSTLATRRGSFALRQQEAVFAAAAVLDSLVLAPDATAGLREHGGWRIRWTAAAGQLVVTAETVDGLMLVELEGRSAPAVPVLPDAGLAAAGEP